MEFIASAIQQAMRPTNKIINTLKCSFDWLSDDVMTLQNNNKQQHQHGHEHIENNIARVPRMHDQSSVFPKGTMHLVNAGLRNFGSICYKNLLFQVIASCPILPACLSNMLTLSIEKYQLYCAFATVISSLVNNVAVKATVDPTNFFDTFINVCPRFDPDSGLGQLNCVSSICSKYALMVIWVIALHFTL